MENNQSGSNFLYFLTGISVGALIGILFAPQSGRETRDYITTRTEEGRGYVTKKSQDLRGQASEYVDRGKEMVQDQKEHLAAAIDAGKQTYKSETGAKAAKGAKG